MTERRRRMEEERKAANFIEAEINKDIAIMSMRMIGC